MNFSHHWYTGDSQTSDLDMRQFCQPFFVPQIPPALTTFCSSWLISKQKCCSVFSSAFHSTPPCKHSFCCKGSARVRMGRQGGPGFTVNPMGQTNEATEHSASLCALQQPRSMGTKHSLSVSWSDPCSPAFLLLFFSLQFLPLSD